MTTTTFDNNEVRSNWRQAVANYQDADSRRSIFQVLNTILPYLFFYVLMIFSLRISYWLSLFLAIPTAGFMVRTFIIFHDCGHGSFFRSKKANDALGIVTGMMVWTAYYYWRRDHAIHHATAGDLDRRGVGDVMTLTVEEYLALPRRKKIAYRVMRHPLILFTIGPLIVFVFAHRFWHRGTGSRERWSVLYTDLFLIGFVLMMSFLIGFWQYVMIQLPILIIACSVGVWLFYVQHNFQGTYWERHKNWDYLAACLKGSSFYRLPRVLQWFSGNIGFHHIHHLSPKIPNYFLERCHVENPIFASIKPIGLLSSLHSLRLRLWDEANQCMVGFSELKKLSNPVG
jgi:omega-6 fatty acid desaturase (delta-12 desaturase)